MPDDATPPRGPPQTHCVGLARRTSARVLAAWLGVSCAGPRVGPDAGSPGAPGQGDIPYAEDPIDPQTRVFLVAGGDDVANFAAEVVEQRASWLAAGVPESAIACYYAKPSWRGWRDDGDQFLTLAEALADCHRADPERLLGDLSAAAESAPDWLYLYVSAHGIDSIRSLLPNKGLLHAKIETIRSMPGGAARLEEPIIGLDADPGAWDPAHLLEALSKPVPSRVFTPRTLRAALDRYPATTFKAVVLQACYSGGFVASPPDPTLSDLPNAVVITATAANRPSFGCGPGERTTYFGGAFDLALGRRLTPPAQPAGIDWRRLFEEVRLAVEAMESVHGERASGPIFVDNREGPSSPVPPRTPPMLEFRLR